MIRIFRASFLSLNLVLLSFMAQAQVIATVGDKKITKEEFNKKYEDIRKQALNAPTRAEFLEDLVRFEVGSQEAEKLGIQKDPLVQERIKAEIYKGLLEKELTGAVQKIRVSDADMAAFYKNNPEIRSSHILIEVKVNATPAERAAAEKRAQQIYKEVRGSKRPFEDLAKLYSDDALSKGNGGDVGWQTRVTLVPAYYEAIKNLDEGKMTGLIDTQFGFHIVKVTGRRSFAEADKRQLRAAVFDEKRKSIFNSYFNNLKKKYKISISKDALK